ncbi:MAG TPA: hypothetical protein PKE55_10345 [Kiritimatiellia bacterium]|nr:hypothetical protein [Kiritimatiellia bacterium]
MSDQNTPPSDTPETPETTPEVVPSTSSNKPVQVSGELLQEAVVQLRRLTELRQKETERHERAMAQMNASIRKQTMLNRLLLFASALVVLVVFGLAFMIKGITNTQEKTAQALSGVDQRLSEAASTVARETEKTVLAMEGVRKDVEGVREDVELVRRDFTSSTEQQVLMAREVEARLREANTTQEGVIARIDTQLDAVRAERDAIREEVFSAIDSRSREFIERELAIQAERERIASEREEAKEYRAQVIADAISRLNAFTADLTGEIEAAIEADSVEPLDEEPSVEESAPVENLEETITEEAESTSEEPSEPADDLEGEELSGEQATSDEQPSEEEKEEEASEEIE